MSESKKGEMDQFLNFLYSGELDNDLDELRLDLKSYGIDVEKLEGKLSRALEEAKESSKHPWLLKAKISREQFARKSKAIGAKLFQSSPREVLQEMIQGKYGAKIKSEASVYFRNRSIDDLSENDLRSFIEDCHLLELLEKDQNGDES